MNECGMSFDTVLFGLGFFPPNEWLVLKECKILCFSFSKNYRKVLIN